MTRPQPLPHECFTALVGKVVDDVTTRHGPRGCHEREIQHPRLVLGDHEHDEDIVDLWQRDERGVEKGDGEETRSSERQGKE